MPPDHYNPRDIIGNMTPEQRAEYAGQVLATHAVTGEILATAATLEAVLHHPSLAHHSGQVRIVQGPPAHPMTLEELEGRTDAGDGIVG